MGIPDTHVRLALHSAASCGHHFIRLHRHEARSYGSNMNTLASWINEGGACNLMTMNEVYAAIEPARAEIDMLQGPALLEFGSPSCGYCRAAQAPLASALADRPRLRHIKIADGRGRPLGRSFKVKLWPTLVFLSNGREVTRLVRSDDATEIGSALARIESSAGTADGASSV